MISPCCKSGTIVKDSRYSEGKTRRRHECQQCKQRFTTYEVSEEYLTPLIDAERKLSRLTKPLKLASDILSGLPEAPEPVENEPEKRPTQQKWESDQKLREKKPMTMEQLKSLWARTG